MPKKFRLDSSTDSDYTFLGIVSHLRDYRLIWFLNDKMNLHLSKMDELNVFHEKKNEMYKYSIYYYEEPQTFKTFYLISNVGDKGVLFSEHRQTNYFLLIKGNVDEELKKEFIENIRTIVNVLAIYYIPLTAIKNVDNFFNDLELHMLDMQKQKKEIKNKSFRL